MPKSRICPSALLSLALSLAILTPYQTVASGGGNKLGMLGTIGGGLLIWHGMKDFSADSAACKSGALVATCKKVALDVLEIAGGAAAMMMNMGNEADTRDDGGFTAGLTSGESPSGAGGGLGDSGLGGLPSLDLADCKAPTCKVDANGRPQLTLPPLDAMKETVSKGFSGNAVNADGVSLEDALKTLDNNYDQAKQAVAAFNTAAAAGKLDSALGTDGSGESNLAGTGSGNSEEETGLNRGAAGKQLASADAGGAAPMDYISLSGSSPLDLEALMNKTKTERGSPSDAKAVGLNLENSRSGKLLNIWERVSRAIRGTRDRDLSLAKIELNRKIALKNFEKSGAKDPNVATSHPKL